MNQYQAIPFRPLYYLKLNERSRSLVMKWILLILFIIPSGYLTNYFDLIGVPINVFGFELQITFYFPMIICVLLSLKFGYLWGSIPAYLSTFIVVLLSDMPLYWVLAFSLSDPIGLAMFVMIYRITPANMNLNSFSSIMVFILASFVASLSGSVGSFIWSYTNNVNINDYFSIWQGWWMGGFTNMTLICGLLLYLFSGKIDRWKSKSINVEFVNLESRNSIKLAIISVTILLILFTFLAHQVNMLNVTEKVNLIEDIATRNTILQAIDTINFPVIIYIFILALMGYFIIYFVDYWALRLEKANAALKNKNNLLYDQSIKDNLTKVHNRSYLFDHLPGVIKYLKDTNDSITIMLLDLDQFKNVNDSYGHQVGDMVLKSFTKMVESKLKKEQVFVRFGGEEFIIVTPKMNKKQAAEFASELNHSARESKLIHEEHEIIVNVSIGIYVTDNLTQFIDKMIDKADVALYEAKDKGRDCFVFYTDKKRPPIDDL